MDFSTIITIIFVVAAGIMVFSVITMIIMSACVLNKGRQMANIGHASQMKVPAKVVAKRSRHAHSMHSVHYRGVSRYYITFEVASMDRVELLVPEKNFGVLIEGDEGILIYKGTMFMDFQRRK